MKTTQTSMVHTVPGQTPSTTNTRACLTQNLRYPIRESPQINHIYTTQTMQTVCQPCKQHVHYMDDTLNERYRCQCTTHTNHAHKTSIVG
ncbi:hypothetical protein Taro_040100 [Colocasia esculenta]|uniref:Uncharacterized protein n=1 Tax=Colocasia esculenta TaxID=4460 RepID=A0A843W833_COLES|nr:hypothetical protein [Colocasia esculenta]